MGTETETDDMHLDQDLLVPSRKTTHLYRTLLSGFSRELKADQDYDFEADRGLGTPMSRFRLIADHSRTGHTRLSLLEAH